jgi:hypothetical protein
VRRALLWINFVAASLVALLVFLQAYLITAYATGAGESALDAHGFVGFLFIHGLEAIVFLSALGAWWGIWKWLGLSFFLILFGTVQIFLAPPEDDPASGWVHGLHGLFALFVMVLAAVIAYRGMIELGLRRARVEPAGGDMPPPPP